MYTIKQQKEIAQLLKEKRDASTYNSDAAFARSKGITAIDYSNVTNLKFINQASLLSSKKWNRIGLLVDYTANGTTRWLTCEKTFVFQYVTTQLKMAKKTSLPTMLIDDAGIGKTHACVCFAEVNENAFYVRCSDAPTTSKLVNAIAKSMGLKASKKTEDIMIDIVMYANSITKPIIILDEAGFLRPSAWNIVHRIYNACEFQLSLFLVGSVGLENELNKGIKRRANGYSEVFSRMGSKYIQVFKNEADRLTNLQKDFEKVIKTQGIKSENLIEDIVGKSDDLRRVRREIIKTQYI